jgi:two-component system LytT family sensor kinase
VIVASENATYYRLINDDGTLFWLLQVTGWVGISLLTYLSLSVPYDQYEWSYLAHNVSQSALGFLLSIPLRYLYRAVWHWSIYLRLVVVLGAAIVFALAWAALRLTLFMVMTGEEGLWSDFGGWLFPSLFVFFTWAALYHGIKYYQFLQREHEVAVRAESAQRQEALRRIKAETEAKEAQMHLLRYQLNPHFLFNTLNSVSALVTSGRADDANRMLLNLSTFLRFSLEQERVSMTTLREEITALELYLDIEKVRFSDRLELILQIAPEAYRCNVPSLLLQPLVENAVKYAISKSETGGVIQIAASTNGSALNISVEDSGADSGAMEDRESSSSAAAGIGLGLQNIRERLETVFGSLAYCRSTTSPLGGMRIEVCIPAEEPA